MAINVAAVELHDQIIENTDPLHLDLEDQDFIQTINDSIAQSVNYYKLKQLPERQDKMLSYYLGNQLDDSGPRKLALHQPRYVENVIYEGVRRIKPIAASRLPDLTVKHGESPEIEEMMTDLLNTDISKRKNRKVLGLAHVHEQIFLYAVIKARWNPEDGDDGDSEFINVYPKNIVWDHRCKTSNADDMRFVAENTETTVKEIVMMFPKAKEELFRKLGIDINDKDQKKLASPLTIWEVWFHWWKEKKDEFGESKWEKVNAVVWKYQEVVLGKMKNPYFDYEGKVKLFSAEMKEKKPLTDDDMYKAFIGELQMSQETVYHNYFKTPRKPYFFMVYESLGQDPIDATNRVEQVLYFQDHINDQGRQIIEMNERSAGKPIFNNEALSAKQIKNLDWRNMKQAIGVGGDDVNKAFAFAQMPAAPQQLYKSKEENRSIAFEMMGVNATTRGVREGGQTTLGQEQMYREQDFGFIDDLVEDTINDAAEWMAQWSMQFIKVFYTKDHYKEIVGKDGDSLFQAVNQDLVSDGMVVEVSASAVDKMMRKQMAVQNMKIGGDLLSYYEDVGAPDPKESARRAFLMANAPQMYYQEYLVDKNLPVQPQDPNAPVAPQDPNAQPPAVAPQAPMAPEAPADPMAPADAGLAPVEPQI